MMHLARRAWLCLRCFYQREVEFQRQFDREHEEMIARDDS